MKFISRSSVMIFPARRPRKRAAADPQMASPGASSGLGLLRLYRSILRAHRGLPGAHRDLGDAMVRVRRGHAVPTAWRARAAHGAAPHSPASRLATGAWCAGGVSPASLRRPRDRGLPRAVREAVARLPHAGTCSRVVAARVGEAGAGRDGPCAVRAGCARAVWPLDATRFGVATRAYGPADEPPVLA